MQVRGFHAPKDTEADPPRHLEGLHRTGLLDRISGDGLRFRMRRTGLHQTAARGGVEGVLQPPSRLTSGPHIIRRCLGDSAICNALDSAVRIPVKTGEQNRLCMIFKIISERKKLLCKIFTFYFFPLRTCLRKFSVNLATDMSQK